MNWSTDLGRRSGRCRGIRSDCRAQGPSESASRASVATSRTASSAAQRCCRTARSSTARSVSARPPPPRPGTDAGSRRTCRTQSNYSPARADRFNALTLIDKDKIGNQRSEVAAEKSIAEQHCFGSFP